jgi:hypothetical protein
VKTLAGILVVVIPATWLAWAAIRVLHPPDESWAQGGSRWMVFPVRAGERRPSTNELRFWASVWLVTAAAILAVGLALGLSQ